jgi:hypothetical protein
MTFAFIKLFLLMGLMCVTGQQFPYPCENSPNNKSLYLEGVNSTCIKIKKDIICTQNMCCSMEVYRLEMLLHNDMGQNIVYIASNNDGINAQFEVRNNILKVKDIDLDTEYCFGLPKNMTIFDLCRGACMYSIVDPFGWCCPISSFYTGPPAPDAPNFPQAPIDPPTFPPYPDYPDAPNFPQAPIDPPTFPPYPDYPDAPNFPQAPVDAPNFPSFPDYPDAPNFPQAPVDPPTFPPYPDYPDAPNFPQAPVDPPTFPPYPDYPDAPNFPQAPIDPPTSNSPPSPALLPPPPQISFPYCECKTKSSRYTLEYIYSPSASQHCFQVQLRDICPEPLSPCCEFTLNKIEFDINPTCLSGIQLFVVNGIVRSPNYSRTPGPIAKVTNLNIPFNMTNGLEVCMHMAPFCTSLEEFCNGDTCRYAIFESRDTTTKCCVTSTTII